jgi:hypothetical protein
MLGADHGGKAWKPSQGFHNSRVGSRRAMLGADHGGKAWKPSQGFGNNNLADRVKLRSCERTEARGWGNFMMIDPTASG